MKKYDEGKEITLGLFSRRKTDDYNVYEYDSANEFAEKWQYIFAMELGIDEDEGYYEAIDYWRKNHKG